MRSSFRSASRYLLIVGVCIGCAQPNSPSGPPRIHFPVVTQDLAEIPLASLGREVEFPFVNRGLNSLHITQLVTSCGCADAIVKPSIVAAGDTGRIVVRIAPAVSEKKQHRWQSTAMIRPTPLCD